MTHELQNTCTLNHEVKNEQAAGPAALRLTEFQPAKKHPQDICTRLACKQSQLSKQAQVIVFRADKRKAGQVPKTTKKCCEHLHLFVQLYC